MKILLNRIKSSPNPIRKTWDEEKMNQLKWSLMEEGQVEPIGVRENDSSYVVVWGHRRIEAARRAGLKEIEAIIIPEDEINNLIQAGIENLSGEDMTTDDKATWAQRLLDLGEPLSSISRRAAVSTSTISKWLTYKKEKEQGVAMATPPERSGDSDYRKIVEIHNVLQDDLEAKKAIAKKVSEDELTTLQTRAVAEAYRDAPTPDVKKAVLKAPIISKDTSADILRRSINRVEMDTGIKIAQERNDWQKERDERHEMEAFDFAVKEFLDGMKLFEQIAQKGTSLIKFGKYSPEAAKFAVRRIDHLVEVLKTYREELENIR